MELDVKRIKSDPDENREVQVLLGKRFLQLTFDI